MADGPFSAPLVLAGVMKEMDIYYLASKTKSQGGFSSHGRRWAGTAGTCLQMELDRVPNPQEQSCRAAAPTSDVHPQNDIPHGRDAQLGSHRLRFLSRTTVTQSLQNLQDRHPF